MRFRASKHAQKHANRSHSSILSKIEYYFLLICDISTFKRLFHTILHAGRTARAFQRRNKPRNSQIATIRRFCRKLADISHPSEIFTTFKRYFHCIMRAEHGARDFQRRDEARRTQIAIIRRFCRKLIDISLPFEIFRRLNARFTPFYMQNVVHAFFIVGTNPDTPKSQPFADFVEK